MIYVSNDDERRWSSKQGVINYGPYTLAANIHIFASITASMYGLIMNLDDLSS